MTWSTPEIESLLHIHEKAQGHGRVLTNIRDEAMSKLQDIELEAKKSQEERIAKAKAEREKKEQELAVKAKADFERDNPKPKPFVVPSKDEATFKQEPAEGFAEPGIYPPESGVSETTVIDRRV